MDNHYRDQLEKLSGIYGMLSLAINFYFAVPFVIFSIYFFHALTDMSLAKKLFCDFWMLAIFLSLMMQNGFNPIKCVILDRNGITYVRWRSSDFHDWDDIRQIVWNGGLRYFVLKDQSFLSNRFYPIPPGGVGMKVVEILRSKGVKYLMAGD